MMLAGEPEASLDPWCIVRLKSGERILFEFATRHPWTMGLSWMTSTPVRSLDDAKGCAVTESGRLYGLGRRFDVNNIRDEEVKAWVAYGTLFSTDVEDQLPPWRFDSYEARRWLASCKVARHLGKTPPPFQREEYEPFIEANQAQYRGDVIRSVRLF